MIVPATGRISPSRATSSPFARSGKSLKRLDLLGKMRMAERLIDV